MKDFIAGLALENLRLRALLAQADRQLARAEKLLAEAQESQDMVEAWDDLVARAAARDVARELAETVRACVEPDETTWTRQGREYAIRLAKELLG